MVLLILRVPVRVSLIMTLTFEPKNGGLLPSNKFVQGDIVVITEANSGCTVGKTDFISW